MPMPPTSLQNENWTEVPLAQSRPGDILVRDGHAEMVATDGGATHFNFGSGRTNANMNIHPGSDSFTKVFSLNENVQVTPSGTVPNTPNSLEEEDNATEDPADEFYYSPEKSQGGMHKGVQIRCMDKSYITNPAFLEYAHELGDTMGITYQDTVRRGGSTNAGKISLAGKAVPTLVLGIPSRYVHSHYNFCAIEDVENTVRMAVEVIKGLNDERIRHLMHQDIL